MPSANLHSIMLLLYLNRSSRYLCQTLHIYIPLCFYFIGWGDVSTLDICTHLHSIMLLLYPYVARICPRSFTIYIPLCFYFIQNTRVYRTSRIQIYIPLCFYFISSTATYTFDMVSFTFHYASTLSRLQQPEGLHQNFIYIPLCFYFIRSGSARTGRVTEFTFHYASTLSTRKG